MNTILLATREAGPRFLFSISGCTQAPSSDLLAHSPTPDQQLPDFCVLGFAHCSKYSGWIKPELTCVYLRANEQFGPCFSSVITQLLFCLLVTPQGSRGEGCVGLGIYFAGPPTLLFCGSTVRFSEKQGFTASESLRCFQFIGISG